MLSGARSSPAALVEGEEGIAIPTEAEIDTSWTPAGTGVANALHRARPSFHPASGSAAGTITPNSSPPSRASTAPSGTAPLSLSPARSEEHTSELQSLMRSSYAVFCLKTKPQRDYIHTIEKTKLRKHKKL